MFSFSSYAWDFVKYAGARLILIFDTTPPTNRHPSQHIKTTIPVVTEYTKTVALNLGVITVHVQDYNKT